MKHKKPHPLAGKTVNVILDHPQLDGHVHEYRVEDYWDRVYGESWMDTTGNFAVAWYAFRVGNLDLPTDDEVLYGKIGLDGHLIHLNEVVEANDIKSA